MTFLNSDEQLDLFGGEFQDSEEKKLDNYYTQKVAGKWLYKPKGAYQPSEFELVDNSKTGELISKINNSDIPEHIKVFLRQAAQRHMKFRYDKIADYYAFASEEVQKLMEESALVIIDADSAIKNGFMRLTSKSREFAEESNKIIKVMEAKAKTEKKQLRDIEQEMLDEDINLEDLLDETYND